MDLNNRQTTLFNRQSFVKFLIKRLPKGVCREQLITSKNWQLFYFTPVKRCSVLRLFHILKKIVVISYNYVYSGKLKFGQFITNVFTTLSVRLRKNYRLNFVPYFPLLHHDATVLGFVEVSTLNFISSKAFTIYDYPRNFMFF